MRLNEGSSCVSVLALDQWASGELDAEARAQIEQHVLSCSHCLARHQEREKERAAFYAAAPSFEVYARKLAPQRVSERRVPRLRRPLLAASGLLAVAACVALALIPQSATTRQKGGPSLGYFVKRDGKVWVGDSSSVLQPGDLLRFTYSSQRDCYLALFDQDARGTQIFYPSATHAAFAPAGKAVALSFSVELDATPGAERVHALYCDASVELAPLKAALAQTGRLPVPEGCASDTLTLRKAGAR